MAKKVWILWKNTDEKGMRKTIKGLRTRYPKTRWGLREVKGGHSIFNFGKR